MTDTAPLLAPDEEKREQPQLEQQRQQPVASSVFSKADDPVVLSTSPMLLLIEQEANDPILAGLLVWESRVFNRASGVDGSKYPLFQTGYSPASCRNPLPARVAHYVRGDDTIDSREHLSMPELYQLWETLVDALQEPIAALGTQQHLGLQILLVVFVVLPLVFGWLGTCGEWIPPLLSFMLLCVIVLGRQLQVRVPQPCLATLTQVVAEHKAHWEERARIEVKLLDMVAPGSTSREIVVVLKKVPSERTHHLGAVGHHHGHTKQDREVMKSGREKDN